MAEWTGTLRVDAAPTDVYAYLSDFSNHEQWDESVVRLEITQPGDANGVGAKWRTYEKLNTLRKRNDDPDRQRIVQLNNAAGVSVREVTELVPEQRVAWHSYMVPRIGVTADCAFDLTPADGGTDIRLSVKINALGVLEAMAKLTFREMEAQQHTQWQRALDNIKDQLARQPVAV